MTAAQWIKDNADYTGAECLIWPFSRDRHGYGQLGIRGRFYRAHRMMCELVNGKAPTPKHHAAHNCGNGHLGCVNPLHLEWKTDTENKRDAIRHKTYPRNKWGRSGKFAPETITEIRNLGTAMTQVELSKRFNISPSALRDILNHRTYKTVNG